MNKNGSYRRFGAWAILLVFLAGWSMGTWHRLVSHHEHSKQLECSADHDPNVAHIHDDRYANEHCSLCAFVLSTPELLTIGAILPKPSALPHLKDSFHCTPSPCITLADTTCLRGPPAL